MYSFNTLFTETNPSRLISESIKTLEIQTSMFFNLLAILFHHAFIFSYLLKKSYCRTCDTLKIPTNEAKAEN